jgi:hypothetical protein
LIILLPVVQAVKGQNIAVCHPATGWLAVLWCCCQSWVAMNGLQTSCRVTQSQRLQNLSDYWTHAFDVQWTAAGTVGMQAGMSSYPVVLRV